MNLKRALIVLLALSLIPVTAFGQRQSVTPAEGTANILVQVDFTDGNYETPVELTLTCVAGTYAPATVIVEPDNDGNGPYGPLEHVFVISNIPDIANNECTVTQTPVDDYEAFYACLEPRNKPPGGGGPNIECNPAETDRDDRIKMCKFTDVNAWNGKEGTVARCVVENDVLPVEIEVTKVWEMFGAESADVDTDVKLTLHCDAYILGGRCRKGSCRARTTLSGADYEDEDGDYTGMGMAVFSVIPEFYSTPADDDSSSQQYTECYVTEDASDNSAVEVDNDCNGLEVAAGMGDECTITNTVFFEGIPTLSQYGMMIMALLMLGVGFVGLRRFV